MAGHRVRALRVTFVGEMGWELHIPRNSCVDVYRALMASGSKHGMVNAGYRAMDSLSVEKGNVYSLNLNTKTLYSKSCSSNVTRISPLAR